jgi:NADPH2:quinone reductase
LPNGKTATFFSITALRKRHPDWCRADLKKLLQLLSEKAIHPDIAERIGLEGVPDAHRRIEGGGLIGKIVICATSISRPQPGDSDHAKDTQTARGFGTLDPDRAHSGMD